MYVVVGIYGNTLIIVVVVVVVVVVVSMYIFPQTKKFNSAEDGMINIIKNIYFLLVCLYVLTTRYIQYRINVFLPD